MRISDWSSDVCSSDLHAVLQTGWRQSGSHNGGGVEREAGCRRKQERHGDTESQVRQVHGCYMNASRLARIFVCVDRHRWVAALYPALLQPDALRAPMKSADMHLILLASSSSEERRVGKGG